MPPLPVSTGHHSASTPPARMGRGFGGFMGVGLQSPAAGKSHRRVTACTPARRGGFSGWAVGACRRRKSFRYYSWHAYPAGAYFCAYKSRQNTLGALPQDPCRWLCWIRISFSLNDREKQIRTAHRIAPKVACGGICPFPPPPFPMAGKGPGWAGEIRGIV